MLERRVHSEEEEEEGEGGLEIDLDYNDYVSVSLTEEEEVEEPLDLRVGRQPIKEERLLASVPLSSHSPEEVGKGTLLTEKDVISLIDPYIGWDRKRAVCTVCDIKFVKREKARAHVENKHLDCLQYKCPLCRASKVEHIFLSNTNTNTNTDKNTITEHAPIANHSQNCTMIHGFSVKLLTCYMIVDSN